MSDHQWNNNRFTRMLDERIPANYKEASAYLMNAWEHARNVNAPLEARIILHTAADECWEDYTGSWELKVEVAGEVVLG